MKPEKKQKIEDLVKVISLQLNAATEGKQQNIIEKFSEKIIDKLNDLDRKAEKEIKRIAEKANKMVDKLKKKAASEAKVDKKDKKPKKKSKQSKIVEVIIEKPVVLKPTVTTPPAPRSVNVAKQPLRKTAPAKKPVVNTVVKPTVDKTSTAKSVVESKSIGKKVEPKV